ncbi:hypothetical protein CENSYa_1832 [Cenarchaeum symbiosum A]|uniref:Uncharacterized protein n=1 Tax=Cenarchaeum symbiosum (strain A) TaxID=414004 RepID=A0RYM5_CENSY|nr:hypothetical protein CENSYa_1832 [Cenarchaeum symbiosum A]
MRSRRTSLNTLSDVAARMNAQIVAAATVLALIALFAAPAYSQSRGPDVTGTRVFWITASDGIDTVREPYAVAVP